jgi:hypothetical protein
MFRQDLSEVFSMRAWVDQDAAELGCELEAGTACLRALPSLSKKPDD